MNMKYYEALVKYIKKSYGNIGLIQYNCLTSFKYIDRYKNEVFTSNIYRDTAIIYILYFPSSKNIYVGQTINLRVRLNRYDQKHYIEKTKTTLVVPYFQEHKDECRVYIIKDENINKSNLSISEEIFMEILNSTLNLERHPTSPRIIKRSNIDTKSKLVVKKGWEWSEKSILGISGKNNNFYGKNHTPESIEKIRNNTISGPPKVFSNMVIVFKIESGYMNSEKIEVTICSSINKVNSVFKYKPIFLRHIKEVQYGTIISNRKGLLFIILPSYKLPYKFDSITTYMSGEVLFSKNTDIIFKEVLSIINNNSSNSSNK